MGGAIRSYLLHLPIHDYDLTTNALPEEMKTVFSDLHSFDTGIQHGTLTVLSDHHPVEITTYRKDSTYEDHRHPDAVIFTSALKEDCERRDFTINALCYHPKEGILDFFEGRKDIERKLIRCIGDPHRRFEEDALRILRALRFAARLSFSIDAETAAVLRSKKETLSYVSVERIAEEFRGILESKGCAVIMEDYREVFEVFLPELKKLNDTEYKAMITMLDEESTLRADVRFSLILYALHDPQTAGRILRRMKYSNAFISTCTDLLHTADEPIVTDIQFRTVLSHMKTDVDTFFAFRKGCQPDISLSEKRRQYAKLTNDAFCWNLKQLAVNGKDLKEMGYQGKEIGTILHDLLQAVINEKTPNEHEALTAYLSSLNQ